MIQEMTERRLSVTYIKKVSHNASLYQHIIEFIEGQKSTAAKNNYALTDYIPPNLLFFGVKDSIWFSQNLTKYFYLGVSHLNVRITLLRSDSQRSSSFSRNVTMILAISP